MNQKEYLIKSILELENKKVKKCWINLPDFLIDDDYYIEVKDLDKAGNCNCLSQNQILEFSKIKKPIFIYYTSKKEIIYICEFIKKDISQLKKFSYITLEIDAELWLDFKEIVPRTLTLNKAICDLIEKYVKKHKDKQEENK